MKPLFCSVFVFLILLFSACSNPGSKSTPVPSEPLSTAAIHETVPGPSSAVTYTIGKVIALEDEFVYIRTEKSTDSEIICAAALHVEFAVIEQTGEWCRVFFDDTYGFMQAKYLEIAPQPGILPVHRSCVYVPAKKETGLVQTKYNNMLTVTETDGRLAIYTESGTLLASDASLVIKDGIITAEPVSEGTAAHAGADLNGTVFLTGETAPVTTPPDPGATETLPEPSPSPVPPASALPAAGPVRIVIKKGKVASSEGIDLKKNPSFVIGKDGGKVITEDKTVIEWQNAFLENATVQVSYGKIYSSKGTIELEPDYYLVPALLKDNLVDVSRYADDITIEMMLAKERNMLGYKVYQDETCLLQKGTLDKLMEAQKKFMEDGYSIIIYDAYRPYSVTVALYEKYKDGTYVAPLRFGSVHNKGAAVDMSLLDSKGNPVEMPSPIHTLDETSNRNNKSMSKAAKANMDYMADVMISCGFTTIESEWWHFSDTACMAYLRTDYDLDKLLCVIYE
ncbi:MAG: M15 family metallopeptidase [Christensenellales bacterium]